MSGLSSGNLAADRRYLWGEGSRKDGDLVAAADLFAQALEAAPGWAAAAFALGECREALGLAEGAAEAYRRCLALAPDDPFGAGLRLARLTGGESPAAMPDRYVARLFDDYADRFDHHLVEVLGYRAPALLAEALARLSGSGRLPYAAALDLGCGTGLMAAALGARATVIDGIDLSPRMIAQAERTGLYRHLHTGEVVDTMTRAVVPSSCDLVVAADVLVYIGDLDPLFAAVARVLMPGGIFAVTVQTGESGFSLGGDMRFRHGRDYLRRCGDMAGLALRSMEDAVLRRDAGEDVAGLIALFAAAGDGQRGATFK